MATKMYYNENYRIQLIDYYSNKKLLVNPIKYCTEYVNRICAVNISFQVF